MLTSTFIPAQFDKIFCVYEIRDNQNKRIFCWWCKPSEVVQIARARNNPEFNLNQQVTVNILSYHLNHVEAQNAFRGIMVREGMPELNKTIRYNRYGMVRCIETGAVYRNQAEVVRLLGVNQSRLCQHLQRAKGFKSIKGLTFEIVTKIGDTLQPVRYPQNKS